MLRALNTGHLPHNVVVFRPAERKNSSIDKIALYAKYWTRIDGKPTVLVCQNDSCRMLTTVTNKMVLILERFQVLILRSSFLTGVTVSDIH